jgi:glycosyltransferase involved in cell wall biosynthesis
MLSSNINFEIIVVDGLSKYESVSIVNNSKLFNKIKLISERDKGVYDAMNKGIIASRGEFQVVFHG